MIKRNYKLIFKKSIFGNLISKSKNKNSRKFIKNTQNYKIFIKKNILIKIPVKFIKIIKKCLKKK
ncbi:L28 family ribosomal protein [Candidatus Vidania fulgoroideorum]